MSREVARMWHGSPQDRQGTKVERTNVLVRAVIVSTPPAWGWQKTPNLLFAASSVRTFETRKREFGNACEPLVGNN